MCVRLLQRKYGIDKLVEEVERDIRFREKKMGKTRGDVAKPKSWMRRDRICREIED